MEAAVYIRLLKTPTCLELNGEPPIGRLPLGLTWVHLCLTWVHLCLLECLAVVVTQRPPVALNMALVNMAQQSLASTLRFQHSQQSGIGVTDGCGNDTFHDLTDVRLYQPYRTVLSVSGS